MYWGVFTLIIVSLSYQKVCTNLTKVLLFFCAVFPLYFLVFPNLLKICTKKLGFESQFLFLYTTVPSFYIVSVSKSSSNSSFEIFSFSRRSSAHLSNTLRFSIIIRFASAYASSIIRFTSVSMAVATPSL